MASNHGDEDSFVAIDMESLLLPTSPTDQRSRSPNPSVQKYKSFSHKRSNQERETKASEVGAAASLTEPCIESKLVVSLTGDQGTAGVVTPTTGRCRRISKRSSARLDPRRVVVMFATLSSMGTLVLLYLTLSMVGGESTPSDYNFP